MKEYIIRKNEVCIAACNLPVSTKSFTDEQIHRYMEMFFAKVEEDFPGDTSFLHIVHDEKHETLLAYVLSEEQCVALY